MVNTFNDDRHTLSLLHLLTTTAYNNLQLNWYTDESPKCGDTIFSPYLTAYSDEMPPEDAEQKMEWKGDEDGWPGCE